MYNAYLGCTGSKQSSRTVIAFAKTGYSNGVHRMSTTSKQTNWKDKHIQITTTLRGKTLYMYYTVLHQPTVRFDLQKKKITLSGNRFDSQNMYKVMYVTKEYRQFYGNVQTAVLHC